jgi:hypothetical protein
MRLTILHLSDIHVQGQNDVVLRRSDHIASAALSLWTETDAFLIAMTGDIAFSGKANQYALAFEFLQRIRDAVQKRLPSIPTYFAAVPGNHDCDFDADTDLRRLVGQQLLSAASVTQDDGSLLPTMLVVQERFFEFLARLTDECGLARMGPGLHHSWQVPVGERCVRFDAYNTAWASRKNETAGLPSPLAFTSPPDHEAKDIVVSLLHHPYSWYEPDARRRFQALIDARSDVVLTGHEHELQVYERHDILSNSGALYVEGDVLHDTYSQNRSGFNVLTLDLQESNHSIATFQWDGTAYRKHQTSEKLRFNRKRAEHSADFRIRESWESWLGDMEIGLSHPFKKRLQLQDVYVWPDLDERQFERRREDVSASKRHSAEKVSWLQKEKRVHIIGASRSGKTALAKQLFRSLHAVGVIPVYVNGDTLSATTDSDFGRTIDRTVSEQYGRELVDAFRQLPPEKRSLILDDFDHGKLNATGKRIVVDSATQQFGIVVIFTDVLFDLEQVVRRDIDGPVLLRFLSCVLRPFGHRLRAQLIRQWYSLGRELTAEESELIQEVSEGQRLIDTVLGKDLLPSYPLFILAILQMKEARTEHRTACGSYGHIYEGLIAQALDSVQQHLTADTKQTYLSLLAYWMFTNDSKAIDERVLDELTDQYFREYEVRFDPGALLKDLEKALILQRRDGMTRFRYPYVYYFCVAKYIQLNLTEQSDQLRARINDMVSRLHSEEVANILVFLVYLTRDQELIGQMLGKARSLFAQIEPCSIDGDMDFLVTANTPVPAVLLPAGSVDKNREEYHRHLDEITIEAGEGDDDKPEADLESTDVADAGREREQLDTLMQINVAFKTLQIVGQVLRNFPGSLKAELKEDMARESYLLGLRTLKALVTLLRDGQEGIREFLGPHLREQRGIKDAARVSKLVDRFLFWLSFWMTYGIVKRVAFSVGSVHLKETYRRVLEKQASVGVELIDIAIKLDHIKPVPVDDVLELYSRIRDKVFAGSILRTLARNHLYLFPMDYRRRQHLCDKLEIQVQDRKMLPAQRTQTRRTKRTRRQQPRKR